MIDPMYSIKIHELKTDSLVFKKSIEGKKPFEIRFNDRNFKVNDILRLKETKHSGKKMKKGKPLVYTGREIDVRVVYILHGYGLKKNWLIMTVELVGIQLF